MPITAPSPIRLNYQAGPDGPIGHQPYIVNGKWAYAYSESPHGNASIPSIDATIDAGWGFCNAWGLGMFNPPEQPHPVGIKHNSQGARVYCTPRGPGAFGRFHEFADGLDAYTHETRLRTDACRRRGLPAILFCGLPRMDAFTPTSPESDKLKILNAWTEPIIRCGYTAVAGDSSGLCAQLFGQETPALRWAEHLLYMGVDFIVETIETVTPSAFPWFNGRFGAIVAPKERAWRDANPGYFNIHCPGCVTRRYLWLQGSIQVDERLKLMREAGTDIPIVDVDDCWGEVGGKA